MKSYVAHYRNKYPGGQVSFDDERIDAFCADGKHRVALRKNGAGQWVDLSEEMGCVDRHDLSPIPKECRAWKLYKDGRIGPAEEYDERAPKAIEVAKVYDGRVPSEAEMVADAKRAKDARQV